MPDSPALPAGRKWGMLLSPQPFQQLLVFQSRCGDPSISQFPPKTTTRWELLPQTLGKLMIGGRCFYPFDAAAPGVLQLLGSAGDGAFSFCPPSTRVSVPLHPLPGSLKPSLAGVVFSF